MSKLPMLRGGEAMASRHERAKKRRRGARTEDGQELPDEHTVAVTKLIATVSLVFPRPKFDGDAALEAGWVNLMTQTLEPYSPAILAEASHLIVNTRKPKRDGKFFPAPAELTDICNRLVALREKDKHEQFLIAKPSADQWSNDRVQLALDMMQTELGQLSEREGWALGLFTFCRKNMRMPTTPQELAECVKSQQSRQHVIDIVEQAEPPLPYPLSKALREFADTVHQKNTSIAALAGTTKPGAAP